MKLKQVNKKLRYPKERLSLVISFLLLLYIGFVFFQLSTGLLIGLIILQLGIVLITQHQIKGNSLQVTGGQFNEVFEIVRENATDLEIDAPHVFIQQDPFINAFTIGFKRPYTIVLTSGLVEAMSRDELGFVIGHEMGHIKFNHARLLSLISPLGRNIAPLSIIYGDWQRRTEYTSDRVGLVLTPKLEPAITAMLKIAVGSKLANHVGIETLKKQIEAGKTEFVSKTGELFLTHPYITNRIRHLIEFEHFSLN